MTRTGWIAVAALGASLVSGGARAECPAPTRSGDLIRPLNEGQAAFSAMDGDTFARATEAASAALRCLGEPVSASVAASWHRHQGLLAFLADDAAGARAAFRAALSLQPGWRLPEDVAPPGNPLFVLYEEARGLGPGASEPAYAEGGLDLLVDGALSSDLPLERPAIVQVLSPDGQVLQTSYVRPGEPLPTLARRGPPPASAPRVVTSAPTLPDPDKRRPPVALLAGSGAALLASGIVYTWSGFTRIRYITPGAAEDDELDGLVTQNHALFWTAGGLALTSVGLGVGAAVAW